MHFRIAGLILLFVVSSCAKEDDREDKAKQAIKDAITREFQHYEGAVALGEREAGDD